MNYESLTKRPPRQQSPSPTNNAIAELSEEDKQRQLQRKADQSDLINWILHYKNPADDETVLRQIRLVME